jgi:hypothetical protein
MQSSCCEDIQTPMDGRRSRRGLRLLLSNCWDLRRARQIRGWNGRSSSDAADVYKDRCEPLHVARIENLQAEVVPWRESRIPRISVAVVGSTTRSGSWAPALVGPYRSGGGGVRLCPLTLPYFSPHVLERDYEAPFINGVPEDLNSAHSASGRARQNNGTILGGMKE